MHFIHSFSSSYSNQLEHNMTLALARLAKLRIHISEKTADKGHASFFPGEPFREINTKL